MQFENQSLFFIFNVQEWDFTLFHANLFSNEYYNPDDLYYEIWVDRCGYLHLTLGSYSVNADIQIDKNEWIRLEVFTEYFSGNLRLSVSYYNEGSDPTSSADEVFDSDALDSRFKHYETNGNLETHIGSFKGLTGFMKGYLAYFGYAINDLSEDNIEDAGGAYHIDGTLLSD